MIFVSGEDTILLNILEATLKHKKIQYEYIPLDLLPMRCKMSNPDYIILAIRWHHCVQVVEQIRKVSPETKKIMLITKPPKIRWAKVAEQEATEMSGTEIIMEACFLRKLLEKELETDSVRPSSGDGQSPIGGQP
ncbi:MAG: hypothetical protein QW540_08690 [Archaeoglobaceae archaeon]